MRFDVENLPSDMALLHRLVRDMAAVVESRDGEIERLQLIIKKLQRAQFGRRSERLDADQLALALEDLDGDIARIRESRPAIATEAPEAPSRRKPLPDHLPREDVLLDIAGDICGRCGGALHAIGESVSEMLDWVPAQFRVVAHHPPEIRLPRLQHGRAGVGAGTADRRRTWQRRRCSPRCWSANIAITCRFIGRPRSSPGRASSSDARPGELGRRRVLVAGTAARATVRARVRLRPAVRRRHADPGARSRPRPHQDRPAVGLCPRGPTVERTRSAGGGLSLRPDRKAERPASHLGALHGRRAGRRLCRLRAAGHSGDVVLAACWAHARRKFYEVRQATGSPVAAEALRRIGELYAIEARVRGQRPLIGSPSGAPFSRPIVQALKLWLEAQLPRVAGRSALAEAIRYALSRWEGLRASS